MKTLKKASITPEYVHYMPNDEDFKEQVLYISSEFGVAIHLCLCGCKNKVVTPINDRHGWNLIDQNGKVSLTPSIGNYQLPCNSHYIITNNVANFV